MNITQQINDYISTIAEPKQSEIETLHRHVIQLFPTALLWFFDGKDEEGKIISNPNIGYGCYTIQYTNGKMKDFYRIGISANTSGISVYVMGLENKHYLSDNYGKTIGKASITAYCIKFKSLKDVNMHVLEEILKERLRID
ncbi:MAG: DUF1801 domain-containing protein [Chitinophagaceae bacterium]